MTECPPPRSPAKKPSNTSTRYQSEKFHRNEAFGGEEAVWKCLQAEVAFFCPSKQ
jgi:hypothetical protein